MRRTCLIWDRSNISELRLVEVFHQTANAPFSIKPC
jgi:hypothetical protein